MQKQINGSKMEKQMKVRVSVAMAVYNGEEYLREQVQSIMHQIGKNDELVISVDPSTDRSKVLALEFAQVDSRVSVIDGPGCGVIKNFESALKAVSGEYIFLADQDDVWKDDKLSICLERLCQENVIAVVHNAVVADEALNVVKDSFFEGSFESGAWKNIIRNQYIGCCMAFKAKLLKYALPFPNHIPMHDQWLGILANKLGGVMYCDKPLLYYRRHKKNVTGKKRSNIIKKIKWRIGIIASILSFNVRAVISKYV